MPAPAAAKPPALRLHARGVYFCRWGGRDHYFHKSLAASEPLYHASLEDWSRWKLQHRFPAARRGGAVTVAQVYALFLEATAPDVDPSTIRWYENHLSRYVNLWGRAPIRALGPHELQDLKTDLARMGYAPQTINHDLGAVKRFFTWAAQMDYCPPRSFAGVRKIPLPPPTPKALPRAEIRAMLAAAEHGLYHPATLADPELPGWRSDPATRALLDGRQRDPRLSPWLELTYYALLRPTETVRLVHREGVFIEEGVFRLAKSKSQKRSQTPRHVVLSPRAQRALESARPAWSSLDSYSAACRRACGPGGPHPLRHSAATHLHRAGAARADIDLLLGHMPPRVSLIYAPVAWTPLREIAARLDLHLPDEPRPGQMRGGS